MQSSGQTLQPSLEMQTKADQPSSVAFSLDQCNKPTPPGSQSKPEWTAGYFIRLALKNDHMNYNHRIYQSGKSVRSCFDTSCDSRVAVFHKSTFLTC